MSYSTVALAKLKAERITLVEQARKFASEVAEGTRSDTDEADHDYTHMQDLIDRNGRDLASCQRDVNADAQNESEEREWQAAAGKAFHPHNGLAQGGSWSERAATAIVGAQEDRALNSGSIDLVSPLQRIAVKPQVPRRVLDLLVDVPADPASNSTEYLRQTVRTNNAATVPDGEVKPTSVFTLIEVVDRLRTVAHVSQPIPIRVLSDRAQIQKFLEFEMSEGVLAAIEALVLTGDGTGENFSGLVPQAGTPVAFTGSAVQVTSNELMAQLNVGEQPTAWIMQSTDFATMALERASTAGPYLNGTPPVNVEQRTLHGLPVVFSPNIAAGFTLLGDFARMADLSSKDSSISWDGGGDLFVRNQAIVRAEVRCTLRCYRPSSFRYIDIAA